MSMMDNLSIMINLLDMTSHSDSLDYAQHSACVIQPFNSRYIRNEKEQEYLKDIWSVQQVSFTFEGVSKPSAIIDKVMLLKKADHDIALQNLKNELKSLYETCEKNIQEFKKHLQLKIDMIRLNIKDKQNNFCEVACVDNEDYEELKSIVELKVDEEVTVIDVCFKYIYSFESKRQSDATEIFKKYHQILEKVLYLQSNDIKKLMEDQIREYNEMALANRKKNEQLKLKLQSSADNFQQTFCIWLNEMKKNKIDVCRKTALSDFYIENENLKNVGLLYFKTTEGKTAFCRLTSRKSLITEIVAQWDLTIPFSVNRLDKQYYQLNSSILSIESTIINFIKSYDLFASKFTCRLFNQLTKLKEIVETSEMSDENDVKSAQNTYDCENQRINNFFEELQNIGCVAVSKLRDKIEQIFKIFKDFGSPWDVQSASFSKLQDSIKKQLENKAEKSIVSHLDLQQIINNEIISLRQESSIEKLDRKLAQVYAILDRKEKKYKSEYEENCKIIKKCKNIVKTDVLQIKNKIDKFLEVNKDLPHSESHKSSHESIENNCFCELDIENIILQELQLIEKQTDSLDNWKSNFLNNMSLYQPSLEKDIIANVEFWENNLLLKSAQNFEKKTKSVEELRKSICKEVYDVRLKELLDHQNNLEKHKKMITGLIQESGKCIDTFLDFSSMIEKYKFESLQMIQEYGFKANKSSQIICLQNMLRNLEEDYKNKINSKINCTSKRMMKKTSLMNNYNESFQREITLFQEGGNFSIEELNLCKKEISQLLKDIQKDESEINQKIKKTICDINYQITNIEKCLFESLNITIKKLNVQEDIINAVNKCKYFVELKKRKLLELNNQTMNEVTNFTVKCHNKLPFNDVTITLNQLIKKIQHNFNFIKQPVPIIDIPENIRYNFTGLNNDKGCEKNSKGNKLQVQSSINKENNFINNEQCNHDLNNFASIAKFIQEALTIINNRALNYYTLLMNKSEHPLFVSRNKSCENCIEKSLQKIHNIYLNACNCWTEETNRILKFFKTVKMPSIDSYLFNEYSFYDENETTLSIKDESNCISVEIDQNFTKFQNMLQEILRLLWSKHSDTNQQINDNEN